MYEDVSGKELNKRYDLKPKQKGFIVKHQYDRGNDAKVAIINKEGLMYAMHVLSPNAFKVWIARLSNADGFWMKSGKEYTEDVLGVILTNSPDAYAKADKEIIEQGFAYPIHPGSNWYYVTDYPIRSESGLQSAVGADENNTINNTSIYNREE